MKTLRGILFGILFSLLSIMLILGAASLSLAEGMVLVKPSPTITLTANPSEPIQLLTPGITSTLAPTSPLVIVTATPVIATTCPHPDGWITYIIQPGDTLQDLALKHGIPTAEIIQANCLPGSLGASLVAGYSLFLPAGEVSSSTPSLTPTSLTLEACQHPAGWIEYIIQRGDNLSSIAKKFGTEVDLLASANCIKNTSLIIRGQIIFVPPITPSPTITQTLSPTGTQLAPESITSSNSQTPAVLTLTLLTISATP